LNYVEKEAFLKILGTKLTNNEILLLPPDILYGLGFQVFEKSLKSTINFDQQNRYEAAKKLNMKIRQLEKKNITNATLNQLNVMFQPLLNNEQSLQNITPQFLQNITPQSLITLIKNNIESVVNLLDSLNYVEKEAFLKILGTKLTNNEILLLPPDILYGLGFQVFEKSLKSTINFDQPTLYFKKYLGNLINRTTECLKILDILEADQNFTDLKDELKRGLLKLKGLTTKNNILISDKQSTDLVLSSTKTKIKKLYKVLIFSADIENLLKRVLETADTLITTDGNKNIKLKIKNLLDASKNNNLQHITNLLKNIDPNYNLENIKEQTTEEVQLKNAQKNLIEIKGTIKDIKDKKEEIRLQNEKVKETEYNLKLGKTAFTVADRKTKQKYSTKECYEYNDKNNNNFIGPGGSNTIQRRKRNKNLHKCKNDPNCKLDREGAYYRCIKKKETKLVTSQRAVIEEKVKETRYNPNLDGNDFVTNYNNYDNFSKNPKTRIKNLCKNCTNSDIGDFCKACRYNYLEVGGDSRKVADLKIIKDLSKNFSN